MPRSPNITHRVVSRALWAVAAALLALPAQAAFAAYGDQSQTVYTSHIAPEAIELADLVPSPKYPNWYWSVSDVWKRDDTFAACSRLSGSALRKCQQVQRARLWAFKLDPTTHAVVAVRSFAISKPQWALDPHIAQNNDWEDMTLGPVRTSGDGTSSANLIIGAIGNSASNPVYDGNGNDITCETRRLIEVREPNIYDRSLHVWSPWKIYDIRNYVGAYDVATCNSEALLQAPDAGDVPRAYMVTRTRGVIYKRSLDVSTGRSPQTPSVAVDSGSPYRPRLSYVGTVASSRNAQFTAADTNGLDIAMVSPASPNKPCQLYRWRMPIDTLATTITSVSPVRDAISCSSTEGLTFTRDPSHPSTFTRDLYTVSDTKAATMRYWFLPWS